MIEAYLYSNCTSCKKAEALLAEAGVDANKRDLFKEKLSKAEIQALFDRAGLTIESALSTRSRPYNELDLATKSLTDDEIMELMSQYPALLKRPIIVNNGKAVVGFKRDAILELVGK